jgi:serine/threonine protein kinase
MSIASSPDHRRDGTFVEGLYRSPGGLDFLSRILTPSPHRPAASTRPPLMPATYSSPTPRRLPHTVTPERHAPPPASILRTPPSRELGDAAAHVAPAAFSLGREPSADPTASRPPRWSLDDFELGRKLGEGRFGKIYLARERVSHAAVVLKCINKEAVLRQGLVEQLEREIDLQYRMCRSSRRVLRLFAYFWDATTVFLVLEHADGGDLRAAARLNGGRLDEGDAALCVGDVAEALAHLHRHGVLHRDVKPENVLLRHGRCKLADFTWAARVAPDDRRLTVCGTLDYLPPEVVRSEEHTEAVDLWCLGVLAYELIVGNAPFERPQPAETCRAILDGAIAFPEFVSSDARDAITGLLQVDPTHRLTAAEVLRHPWIAAHRPTQTGATPFSPFLSSLRHQGRVARSRSQPLERNASAAAPSVLQADANGLPIRHPRAASGAPSREDVSRALDMSGGDPDGVASTRTFSSGDQRESTLAAISGVSPPDVTVQVTAATHDPSDATAPPGSSPSTRSAENNDSPARRSIDDSDEAEERLSAMGISAISGAHHMSFD